MKALAERAIACCRELATFTEEPDRTTRTFLSPPMRDVHRVLGAWMERLGMRVSVDAAGNLRGIRRLCASRRLLIASHLDTVPNAGAFDGVLGVVLGIALVDALADQCPDLAIEVIGFSEEEGVKFSVPFIGSRALVGTLDHALINSGVGDAIRAFGLDPADIPKARLTPDTIGYLEFHIEQGPVLESLGLPLGIVDAIAGQSRLRFTFTGVANHAGTTPMNLRRDAITAAAEWIGCVEALAGNTPGLVATTGSISVEPNATNVIAGLVRVSLDIRHPLDETREAALNQLTTTAEQICQRRGITLVREQRLNQAAVPMNPHLTGLLTQAVTDAGFPIHRIISGAGHDAMIIAAHVPAAMLFLRSPGGISHHPDESVITEDVAAALEVGLKFIERLEAAHV